MAKLELSSEQLFLFRASLHKVITDKDRSIRDTLSYANSAKQREQADPQYQPALSSTQLFMVAESMQESLTGLQELHSIVEKALESERAVEPA